jgi:hypothetical protein
MFRKAAIVLALAASFLGAQAADLPKPVRELKIHNKTKTKQTAHGGNARAKAKSVTLCLGGDGADFATVFSPEVTIDPESDELILNPDPDVAEFVGNFGVYKCADTTTADPEAIGVLG